MEFSESLKAFSNRVSNLVPNIHTEEATKMSLIVPFFQLLGYDVFNPNEFCPEYVADVGIKKGEKIDYAILDDGDPQILIECKDCTESLDKHGSQLFRYFATSNARFAILTNGIVYRFYTDLEKQNVMDQEPFLEFNFLDLKDYIIPEIAKFCKDKFNSEDILSTAEELKYSTMMKDLFAAELETPSDAFINYVLAEVYPGKRNQQIRTKFAPIVKKSFSTFINDIVNRKISAALEKDDAKPEVGSAPAETKEDPEPISKIVTTPLEIESFYIIRAILAEICPIEDIVHRDTESYFGILYRDNNRCTICRLYLSDKRLVISLPDENKKFTKYDLESLNDLYDYKDKLVAMVKSYIAKYSK